VTSVVRSRPLNAIFYKLFKLSIINEGINLTVRLLIQNVLLVAETWLPGVYVHLLDCKEHHKCMSY